MALEYCDMYGAMFSNVNPNDFSPSYEGSSIRKIDKDEAINELRKMVYTKARNLSIPLLSNEFLLRFLYARKMNIENAFDLLISYFSFRKKNPTLFENLNVSDEYIQQCFHDGLPFVLKNKDRKGRQVLLFLLYQWDHTKYSIEAIYRSLVLSMEYLLNDFQNLVNGFVFIVDWSNFKFRDYVDISPKMLKLMIDGFQDSFPAKIKGIHFIGQPWYVDGILTVVKQFLKEKTRQKVLVHGTNLSSLHEHLPLDVVVPELGGEGSAYRPDEFIEILKNFEEK